MKQLASLIFIFITCAGAWAMERPPARPSSAPTPALVPQSPFPTPPAALMVPEESAPFTNAPGGAGIDVDFGYQEETGILYPKTELTILFPDPMVSLDRIDARDAQSPIVAWPDLNAKWIWRTQSQGMWSVSGPLIPEQTYHLRLRDELKNLAGVALPVMEWGLEFKTEPLTVSYDYEQHETLSSRPQVPLEFNFPVRLHDAAEGCWFQDRLTRERFPAEVLLNRATSDAGDAVVNVASAAAQPTPMEFRVRPRAPLPVGRFYDLIIENVHDAYAGRTPPYPMVIPLGHTRPLDVDFVAARNWPTDKPHIEVKFTEPLGDDPLPADAVHIDPPVSNFSLRKERNSILVDGNFDLAQRYRVNIAAGITGIYGYALPKPQTWGATFHPKTATLLFPVGTIRQRSSLGLRFAMLQANTGPVNWRLARIPLDRFEDVQIAASENKPLIDDLHLEIVAKGDFPASSDDLEVVRTIDWTPPTHAPALSGPYLIEANAKNHEGATVSNTALVFFNEVVFTQKTSQVGAEVRLARMSNGEPMAGVPVKLMTSALVEIAQSTTNQFGVATFPADTLVGASFFIAETPEGRWVDLTEPGSSFQGTGSPYFEAPRPYLGTIISDRPLYRPGDEVKFKGFVRRYTGSKQLTPAEGTDVKWRIENWEQRETLAEGHSKVNAYGGWDAGWESPPQGRLGNFRIVAYIGEEEASMPCYFRIEEFRNPPFSVVCESVPAKKAAESTISVSSEYFHGAPNVGSRVQWTAMWISDSDGENYNSKASDGFKRVDLYSEHHRTPLFETEMSGEAALDEKGHITITAVAPFKDSGLRANCTVLWRVDVTGPDGQTITSGLEENVTMNDVTLGVRAEEADVENGRITFSLSAIPRAGSQSSIPAEVQAALFLVKAKSLKERLAPFVYRYRNTNEFELIERKQVPASGQLIYEPKKPGRYVLVVTPLSGRPGITISEETYLSAPGESQNPVASEQTLLLHPVHGDKPVNVGENAVFDLLTPSSGVAWVTVETDRVLDTFTVPVPGNTTRLEIPIKPHYVPNVQVSVYLLRPGAKDDLPGEMYGSAEVHVMNPRSQIALAISTNHSEYQPREQGMITVAATAAGQPIADAEIALYAVDDSILKLGDWSLPSLFERFQPENRFAVVTHAALANYIESFNEKSLMQKGYVIGGAGKDEFGNTQFIRKNFRPLIFWLPSLHTDAYGMATANFETPDNLTRFRIIALAQTKENQFGAGDATFNVSKPLLIEPALPRFVRQGDEVELRAIARQKKNPEEKLTIHCFAEDDLILAGPSSIQRTAKKGEPAVAVFRARVAENATTATVRFSVNAEGGDEDEVEVTLPVASRTITVNESIAGTWSGSPLEPGKLVPAAWRMTPGEADFTLSTSPYLPKLLGLPAVLDYPYGCFEQKSSRLLVYTSLLPLLEFLPQAAERTENYNRVITQTFHEFEKSLLPDGSLPYWPYDTTTDSFVTIEAAWAVAKAEEAGYEVPEDLASSLERVVRSTALRKKFLDSSSSLRAFAFFVLSQRGEKPDEELMTAARELFLDRERLDDEGRAFLAIALHNWELDPEHQETLLQEIPARLGYRPFNPRTFSSTPRAEAVATLARLLITPDAVPESMKTQLESRLHDASNLSTQENLWLLMAFDAMIQKKTALRLGRLTPPPTIFSKNHSAAAWIGCDLSKLSELNIHSALKGGTFYIAAKRMLAPEEQAAVTRGLRIERIVKNLTDPARTGTADAPFRLGDQVLISFRFYCDQPQNYVAIEDALPAGLEILNPNLKMIGQFYQVPDEPGFPTAELSFSEMRERQTNLFFNELSAGPHSYAILARATAAGNFAWPSTQIAPMYDARSYARTAPSQCVVTE